MKTEEGRGALIFLELWTCSGELSVNNDDLGSPSAVKPSFENRWNVMKCENFFMKLSGLLPVFDAVIIENCLARRGIQSNNPFLFHTLTPQTHISASILAQNFTPFGIKIQMTFLEMTVWWMHQKCNPTIF